MLCYVFFLFIMKVLKSAPAEGLCESPCPRPPQRPLKSTSHFIPEFTPGRCRPDTTGTPCPADSDRSRSPSGLVLMRPGHCHLCAGARPFGSAAPVLLTPSPGVSLQAPSDSSLSFQCILGRRGRSWYRQRCSGPGQGAAVSSFLPQGLTWASSCRLWRPPLSLAVSFSGEKAFLGPWARPHTTVSRAPGFLPRRTGCCQASLECLTQPQACGPFLEPESKCRLPTTRA